jgi:hypothetical protein
VTRQPGREAGLALRGISGAAEEVAEKGAVTATLTVYAPHALGRHAPEERHVKQRQVGRQLIQLQLGKQQIHLAKGKGASSDGGVAADGNERRGSNTPRRRETRA